MNLPRRFIQYSVIYWLLFVVLAGLLIYFQFVVNLQKYINIYDLMGITELMPPGLRMVFASLRGWWGYLLFSVIIYIGTCSKLRRNSLYMLTFATSIMLIMTSIWAYAWYWLEYVLPTLSAPGF